MEDRQLKPKNVHVVRSKGRKYYYHRPTKTRIFGEPDETRFWNRVNELNGQLIERRGGFHKSKADRGSIYFIRAESGPIKIGFTMDAPEKRWVQLQQNNFEELTLVSSISPATEKMEKALHKKLDDHRIRGEWYRPDPAVSEAFADLFHEVTSEKMKKTAR